MFATKKTAIMQYSKLVDNLCILCPPLYGDEDMNDYDTVLLEYVTPISKMYKTDILVKSDELYHDCIKYTLPIDTTITAESGDLELQLSFIRTDADSESGTVNSHVRKISPYTLKVFPIANWAQFIPDSALTILDQKISQLQVLQQEIINMQESIINGNIDDDSVEADKTWSSKKINTKFDYFDKRIDNLGGIG